MRVSRRRSTTEYKAANCPKRWKGDIENQSALLTSATMAAMKCHNTSLGICETWTSDSRATSTATSSFEDFLNYTVEPEGKYVGTADGKWLPVVGCGQLEIVAEKSGGSVIISLLKVLHVPKPERNLISERHA